MNFIHKHITSYLDGQAASYQPLSKDEVQEFASDGTSTFTLQAGATRWPKAAVRANQSMKFLKLILLVAITPPNQEIVEHFQNLPQQTQQVIYRLIHEIDPSQSSSGDEDAQGESGVESDQTGSEKSGVSSPEQRVTRELELEAQQAELQAKLNRREREVGSLKAERKDLDGAYQRLQESYEAIKKHSAEQEDQLNTLASAHIDRDQLSVRELEFKISQQEELISGKEFQITEHQSREAELERRIAKLNVMAEEFPKLQDEFDIQKNELLEQTKKANIGERYKQKAQAIKVIEKDRDSLRQQLEDARPKLSAYEEIRRDNARLAKENREISSTLSRSEIGNSELRATKQGVVAENDRLRRELKAMREAYAEGQGIIADLGDRSSSSEIHSSPTLVDGGLESELAATSKQEEQMQVLSNLNWCTQGLTEDRKSRMFELERQNQRLADDSSEKEFKIAMLQQQLDSAQELSADQSAKELRLHQDISALESFIPEVHRGLPIEGSVSPILSVVDPAHKIERTPVFKRMRDRLSEEQKIRSDLEDKLSTAQKDVEKATNDRTSSFERHCMMSDLNIDLLEGELVDKPKLEMIAESRKQSSAAQMQIQSELDALRKRYDRLQQEFDKQGEERNQAWRESHEAIVASANREAKAAVNDQSLHEMTDMILEASKGGAADLKASIEDALRPTIEGNRGLLAEQQQVQKHQDAPAETLLRSPQPSARSPSISSNSSRVKRISRRFFGPNDANIL